MKTSGADHRHIEQVGRPPHAGPHPTARDAEGCPARLARVQEGADSCTIPAG